MENPRQSPPTHSERSNRFHLRYIKHANLGDCSALISTLNPRLATTISNAVTLDIHHPKTVGALGMCGWAFPTPNDYTRLLTADVSIHASGVYAGKPRGRNTHAPGCSCRPLVPDVRRTHRTWGKQRRCDHRTSSASSSATNNPHHPQLRPLGLPTSTPLPSLPAHPPTVTFDSDMRQSFPGHGAEIPEAVNFPFGDIMPCYVVARYGCPYRVPYITALCQMSGFPGGTMTQKDCRV